MYRTISLAFLWHFRHSDMRPLMCAFCSPTSSFQSVVLSYWISGQYREQKHAWTRRRETIWVTTTRAVNFHVTVKRRFSLLLTKQFQPLWRDSIDRHEEGHFLPLLTDNFDFSHHEQRQFWPLLTKTFNVDGYESKHFRLLLTIPVWATAERSAWESWTHSLPSGRHDTCVSLAKSFPFIYYTTYHKTSHVNSGFLVWSTLLQMNLSEYIY